MNKISGLVTIIILLVVLGGALAVAQFTQAPCKEGCNVILIMVDTLSARHLKTYGYDRDTMPKTTAFFEKGVIFEDAMSNATWTLPSFTGLYFSDIASRVTYKDLAERTRPHLQGELRKNGVVLKVIRVPYEAFIMDGIYSPFNNDEVIGIGEHGLPFKGAREALTSLTEQSQPFFLLVHTFEAHGPYDPQPPYNEHFGHAEGFPSVDRKDLTGFPGPERMPTEEENIIFRLRYDQQIAETDERIAEFLNSIDEETLKKTVVILSADHGEAFAEHGRMWHANAPFQEEIHVPLMMRIPGISARRVKEPVSHLDMTPTILSFFNIPVPETFVGDSVIPLTQGRSLGSRSIPLANGHPYYPFRTPEGNAMKSLAEAGAEGVDRPIVNASSFGIRKGNFKAFTATMPEVQKGYHWYDLSKDPDEKNNLAKNGADDIPENLLQEIEALRPSEASLNGTK